MDKEQYSAALETAENQKLEIIHVARDVHDDTQNIRCGIIGFEGIAEVQAFAEKIGLSHDRVAEFSRRRGSPFWMVDRQGVTKPFDMLDIYDEMDGRVFMPEHIDRIMEAFKAYVEYYLQSDDDDETRLDRIEFAAYNLKYLLHYSDCKEGEICILFPDFSIRYECQPRITMYYTRNTWKHIIGIDLGLIDNM